MPWDDDLDGWLTDFRSLSFLKRFWLRTWYPLKDTNEAENDFLFQWLNFAPPNLEEATVWTGARQNRGRSVLWRKRAWGRWTHTDDSGFMDTI